MFETVEIPVWALLIGAFLALIAAVERVLGPSLRWVLRRQANRAIEEMNQRLDLRLQPFKLTKRRVVIDRLVYDAEVMEAVEDHAAEQGQPRDVSFAEAEVYAREIVPAFSAVAYFKIGTRISRWFCNLMYRVRVAELGPLSTAGIDNAATVVFVMNHRSNMDYLLVTHLVAERSALSYAVGEWAQVWPLNAVIRAMGGYFIRRRSRSALYRRVLARYVRMATEGGVTQAVFPEGGLSRDGRLQPPKLGLLSYILEGFREDGKADVVFIPVGINYDRVLEDRILTSAETDRHGRPRFRVPIVGSVIFVATAVVRRLFGWYTRHGYACVTFGEPLSLRAHLRDTKSSGGTAKTRVETLGRALFARVGRAVPLTPVALIAEVMLAAGRPLSRGEIGVATEALKARYIAAGAHAVVPAERHDDAVAVGLRMLLRRRILIEQTDGLAAAPGESAILRYYANSIAHLADLPDPALSMASG